MHIQPVKDEDGRYVIRFPKGTIQEFSVRLTEFGANERIQLRTLAVTPHYCAKRARTLFTRSELDSSDAKYLVALKQVSNRENELDMQRKATLFAANRGGKKRSYSERSSRAMISFDDDDAGKDLFGTFNRPLKSGKVREN